MNEKGLQIIKEFEGLRLTAYKCPAGIPTIGYGHTAGVTMGMSITKEKAEELLADDVAHAEAAVRRNVRSCINENQLSALVSFTFNLGEGNLRNSTLLKKVNANPDDPSIQYEFAKWVFAGKKKLEGLMRRRKKEAELYFGVL